MKFSKKLHVFTLLISVFVFLFYWAGILIDGIPWPEIVLSVAPFAFPAMMILSLFNMSMGLADYKNHQSKLAFCNFIFGVFIPTSLVLFVIGHIIKGDSLLPWQ